MHRAESWSANRVDRCVATFVLGLTLTVLSMSPFTAACGQDIEANEVSSARRDVTGDAPIRAEIGSPAPDVSATASDGSQVSLEDFSEVDVVVVVFTCNSCPVANAYEPRFQKFAEAYRDKNVALLAINNSVRENIESVKDRVRKNGLTYVYAYEGSGRSALEYGARVTPHCFVLDRQRTLVYKGAFDDQWQSDPSTHYVRDVVDSLLSGTAPKFSETKALGCTIKLRSR